MKKGILTILLFLAMSAHSRSQPEIEGMWITDIDELESSMPEELKDVMVAGSGDGDLTEEQKKALEENPAEFIRTTTLDIYRHLTITIEKKRENIYLLSFSNGFTEEPDQAEMKLDTDESGSMKLLSEDGEVAIGIKFSEGTLIMDGIGPTPIPMKRKNIEPGVPYNSGQSLRD